MSGDIEKKFPELQETEKTFSDAERIAWFKRFLGTGLLPILKWLKKDQLRLYPMLSNDSTWTATDFPISNKETFLEWKNLFSDPGFEQAIIDFACGKKPTDAEKKEIQTIFFGIVPILLKDLNRRRVSWLIENKIPPVTKNTFDYSEVQEYLERCGVVLWEWVIQKWPFGSITVVHKKRYFLRCKIGGEVQDIECWEGTTITSMGTFLYDMEWDVEVISLFNAPKENAKYQLEILYPELLPVE